VTAVVTTSGTGPFHAYAFDPARFGFEIAPIRGTNPPEVYPIAPTAVRDAVAQFTGPMSDFAPHDAHNAADGDQGYRTSRAYRPLALHWDAGRGINIPSRRPKQGLTFGVAGGAAVVQDGGQLPQGATIAIQGFPALVRHGVAQPVDDTTASDREITGRSAIARFRDGRLGVIAGAGSLTGLRDATVRLGAIDAAHLDGGGSYYRRVGDRVAQSGNHRRLASWIVVRADDSSDGGGSAALALLLLLASTGRKWIRKT
jgi:hypothetical protein